MLLQRCFLPRLTGALAGLALFAFTPLVSAQVVVDDFENDFDPNVFVFSGGENGTLSITTDTPDGSSAAAFFEVDGDEYGGFTGFGQPIAGGALDLTGVNDPVLEFDAAATGTFTLEINFQNTGGGGEGEIRNALRFVNADGTYQRYRLSLASFFTTNAASFELDDVFQYVWTVVFAEGDSDTGTNETSIKLDNVQVVEGLGFETDLLAYDFDDGDYGDGNGFFYFAGGEAITASATTDTPDGSANAFSGVIDGDEFGGFAGFGAPISATPLDVTAYESLNFFLRTNGSAVLEVNLQTVQASGENEARERIKVSDTGGEYALVSIPLEALLQSGANPPDLSQVINFVFTFVEVTGDGNTGTTEFAFDLDAIGFGTQTAAVATEALPESFAVAPIAFPNPASASATIAFELATPSSVRVDVIDLLGRQVATLADEGRLAGLVRLDVPTESFVPGTYVIRVQTDDGFAMTRLTVVR